MGILSDFFLNFNVLVFFYIVNIAYIVEGDDCICESLIKVGKIEVCREVGRYMLQFSFPPVFTMGEGVQAISVTPSACGDGRQ